MDSSSNFEAMSSSGKAEGNCEARRELRLLGRRSGVPPRGPRDRERERARGVSGEDSMAV
jgi:hypothetical protein